MTEKIKKMKQKVEEAEKISKKKRRLNLLKYLQIFKGKKS